MLRTIAFLSSFALLIGLSTAANACSSLDDTPQTRAQLFAKASTVFVAHFLRTEEVTGIDQRMPDVEATFRTIEIFKGRPPVEGKVRSFVFGPGNCSVPLLAGSDYLLFLHESNRVLLPDGSELIVNLDGTEPKQVLQELRELAKSSP